MRASNAQHLATGKRNLLSDCRAGHSEIFRKGMTPVIALTQFIFIALGTLGVTIMVKTSDHPPMVFAGQFESFAGFLASQSVWFLALPIFWIAYGVASDVVKKGIFRPQVAQPVGIGLCVLIFLVYSYAIIFDH